MVARVQETLANIFMRLSSRRKVSGYKLPALSVLRPAMRMA